MWSLLRLYFIGSIIGAATLAAPITAFAAQQTNQTIDIVRTIAIPGDPRFDYYSTLLKAALDITADTYGPYKWVPWHDEKSNKRHAEMLQRGTHINVVYSARDGTLDGFTTPIETHLRKGVNGYRVLLIRETDAARFAAVNSIDDLRAFTAGQGRGWPDVVLYQDSDLPVNDAGEFRQLFPMLKAGRFDYYPLGIVEAHQFLQDCGRSCEGIIVEPTLLLQYPFPIFFHVSTAAPRLLTRLSEGMERLVSSGEFEKLWQSFHAQQLAHIRLAHRKLIELPNKHIPAFTKLDDPALWIDLKKH